MLKYTDTIFGIELTSRMFSHPVNIWFAKDNKGNIYDIGKRKIKCLGGKNKEKNYTEVLDEETGEVLKTPYQPYKSYDRIQTSMP